jgi:phosphatidylglycerol:prolipoprotein diacylglycerol transferase
MYPVLFDINLGFLGLGVAQFRTYSLMLLIAFVVAIIVFWILVKRRTTIDTSIVSDLAFWVIVGVVVGARLAYVFMHWSEFASDPVAIFKIWEGGAVYYGGFILAFGFGALYLWRKKIPVVPLLDMIAPVVALGEGIGRLGCFFNGCCFGKPTDVCGITFPAHSFASSVFGPDHSIWPTQLFQVGGGILLFIILMLLMRFVRLRKGQLFSIFLLGFGGLRLGVNFFRYYENSLNLWTNNLIAIAIMVAGIVTFIVFLKQEKVPTFEWVAAERKKLAEAKHKEEAKETKRKKRYRKSQKGRR